MSQVLTEQYIMDYAEGRPQYSYATLSTRDEAMMFNHRVRIWRIIINVSLGGLEEHYNGTYYMGQGEVGAGSAAAGLATPIFATEHDICTLRDLAYPNLFTLNMDYVPAANVLTLLLGTFLVVTTTAGVETEWDIETSFEFGNLVTLGFAAAETPSAATMTVNGHTVTLWEPGISIPAAAYTGSITIDPVEWWEYRPTSGGLPVFDSATGTQINPNVVID